MKGLEEAIQDAKGNRTLPHRRVVNNGLTADTAEEDAIESKRKTSKIREKNRKSKE